VITAAAHNNIAVGYGRYNMADDSGQ